jgi:hypothetical protein
MSPPTGLVLRAEISLLVIAALFRFIDLRPVVDRLFLLTPVLLVAIFAIVLAQTVLFSFRWSFVADFCSTAIRRALAVRFTIVEHLHQSDPSGDIGLIPRPTGVPVAQSEAAEAPVPMPR